MRELQDKGAIEVMTCGATHGYMPLLGYDKSINLQVKAAKENYKKHFGRDPRGIWLPECAYRPSYDWHSYIPVAPFNQKRLRPGVEQFLAYHDIKYFVIDEELIKGSSPVGRFVDDEKLVLEPFSSENFRHEPWNFDKSSQRIYEISSSEKTEYGTAAAFTRHHDISMQVWSGDIGYPAQPDYLDFHKKHLNSMLRYWRVTDTKADMMYKTLYHPDWTQDKIDHQSMHFIHHIENSANYYNKMTGRFNTLCTPFDTELFGHWWFEGPQFIKAVLKGIHHSPYVNAATASEQYLGIKPKEVVSIPEGSWGENNNHDVWSNDGNKWTWEAIYNDELRLNNILESTPGILQDEAGRRIIKQVMRELMLLHSSDWQFLIYTESARDYAEQRFSFHHSDFNRLCDLAEKFIREGKIGNTDEKFLAETEQRNSIFPEIQPEWWSDMKQ
jgi:1,4-alpha-glucan branching enzyme